MAIIRTNAIYSSENRVRTLDGEAGWTFSSHAVIGNKIFLRQASQKTITVIDLDASLVYDLTHSLHAGSDGGVAAIAGELYLVGSSDSPDGIWKVTSFSSTSVTTQSVGQFINNSTAEGTISAVGSLIVRMGGMKMPGRYALSAGVRTYNVATGQTLNRTPLSVPSEGIRTIVLGSFLYAMGANSTDPTTEGKRCHRLIPHSGSTVRLFDPPSYIDGKTPCFIGTVIYMPSAVSLIAYDTIASSFSKIPITGVSGANGVNMIAAANEELYVLGSSGWNGNGWGVRPEIYRVDPTTGAATETPWALETPRNNAICVTVGKQIVIIGGTGSQGVVNTVEVLTLPD